MSSGVHGIAAAVNAAPMMINPIEVLLARAAVDPAACLEPEAVEELTALRAEKPADYQRTRAELLQLKANVRELDRLTGGEGRSASRGPSQGEMLMEIAAEAEFFRTPGDDAYADIIIDGHRETWAVNSGGFRRWLLKSYFEQVGSAPSNEALQSAIATMGAKAQFGDIERTVHIRVASYEAKLYLDMADASWRAIEIDTAGWRMVTQPPVRFRRAKGMLPLPEPRPGGSIQDLRPFLNVASDADFLLTVSWLAAALRHGGPYPVMVLSGEQGSSKSTFASFLRALVDPSEAPLNALPRDEQNLFISATNSHVVAFDNVSDLRPWLSDGLCKIATGGSFKTRQLYTNNEEVMFAAIKPIILNGIGDMVTRPDLGDRAIFIELQPIAENRRRPARELEAEFEAARSSIFGALLDMIVLGLKRQSSVTISALPRMADYAKWAVACEPALGPSGCFMAAFDANRKALVDDVLEGDPVASAVLAFVRKQPSWTGTATELLTILSRDFAQASRREWPDNARSLADSLRRMIPFLRKKDVSIEWRRVGHERHRMISIEAFGAAANDNEWQAAA
jgi:hypothetical protein